MNFKESLEYLLGLGNEVLAMKLGLENIGKLLDALGNPEKNYLKIQIAGTNGKGSVCVFLEAICTSAEINIGMTTSPHLVSITERIKINGQEISEKDFARHATHIREISEKLVEKGELETVPTYFEQVTAIALNAFSEAKIELAILETGLGGRFDAATAANAEIAAITPIDYDHQNILGNTLSEIAAEKAAIIRADTKVVIAPEQFDEAMQVIVERCDSVKVRPHFSDYKTELYAVDTISGRMIAVFYGDEIYHDIWLGLSGRHQLSNARVAINLAEVLRKDFNLKIEKYHIEEGLEKARNKGRLEFYKGILFDGAHNMAGAKALKEYLDEFIRQPITMIFGAMQDKDLSEIAAILFPLADKLILTVPDNQRSMKTAELLKFVPQSFDKKSIIITETVAESIEKAREVSSKNHLILITGSLYLVGEAQKILKTGI